MVLLVYMDITRTAVIGYKKFNLTKSSLLFHEFCPSFTFSLDNLNVILHFCTIKHVCIFVAICKISSIISLPHWLVMINIVHQQTPVFSFITPLLADMSQFVNCLVI